MNSKIKDILQCLAEFEDCLLALKINLEQLNELEQNIELSEIEKLDKLKIIREENRKIDARIDKTKLVLNIIQDSNIN